LRPSSFSRSFGFPSKMSLTSFVSMRQNSATNLRTSRPSESQCTLYAPSDGHRRSGDDGDSSRSVSYNSSLVSGELRKSKSSLNLFEDLCCSRFERNEPLGELLSRSYHGREETYWLHQPNRKSIFV